MVCCRFPASERSSNEKGKEKNLYSQQRDKLPKAGAPAEKSNQASDHDDFTLHSTNQVVELLPNLQTVPANSIDHVEGEQSDKQTGREREKEKEKTEATQLDKRIESNESSMQVTAERTGENSRRDDAVLEPAATATGTAASTTETIVPTTVEESQLQAIEKRDENR